MKITLEFEDGEEDNDGQRSARLALAASDLYCALYEVDQHCRTTLKHDDKIDEHTDDILERIREICSVVRDYE